MIVSKFLIGPGRSGTSLLYQAIKNIAPDRVPIIKEPQFFDRNYEKGLDWYHSKYSWTSPGERWDFSNRYYISQEVPDRIFSYNKNAHIYFVCRDPKEVFRSMLYFERRKGSSYDQIRKIAKIKWEECQFQRYLDPFYERFTSVTLIDFRRISDINYMSEIVSEKLNSSDLQSKINQSQLPRFRLLGWSAKRLARSLRAAEMDKLLDGLKSSSWIKSIVLKNSGIDENIEIIIEDRC